MLVSQNAVRTPLTFLYIFLHTSRTSSVQVCSYENLFATELVSKLKYPQAFTIYKFNL